MIVSMLMFEILIGIFIAHFIQTIPIWLKVLCFAIWFTSYFVAFVSEDMLRSKVKSLEDEIKKLKKSGE